MSITVDARRWRQLRTRLADPALVSAAEAEAQRVLLPWESLTDLDMVRSLMVQVAVIGNARGGYRFGEALRQTGVMDDLVAHPAEREASLHHLARSSGVRFVGADLPSPKVTAWTRILAHPDVVREGRLIVRERIADVLQARSTSDRQADRNLREQVLGWGLPMIGRKSWSDWLNNRGLTRHLLAIDTRLVGVWKRELGVRVRLEDFQDAATYDTWESANEQHLARPLGITLSELDKRLFMLPTLSR